MQGIYWIRNKVNGKRYIGSSNKIKARWKGHRRTLNQDEWHENPYLQRAWNKYGETTFEFEIVEVVKGSRDAAYDREQEYLDEWFPTGLLYNISKTANHPPRLVGGENGMFGKHHSQETKQLIRAKRLQYCETHELSNKGKPCLESTKKAVSEANKGRKHTAEELRKMSAAHKGNERASRFYPAFTNDFTGEFIPAGKNLIKTCKQNGLNYWCMCNVKSGATPRTRDGWRLAD